MDIYTWPGPEQDLAFDCTVLAFTVESLDREKLTANGSITIKDYMEGVEFSCPWNATGRRTDSGALHFDLEHSETDKFIWRDETGKPMFTINSAVNSAIQSFGCAELRKLAKPPH